MIIKTGSIFFLAWLLFLSFSCSEIRNKKASNSLELIYGRALQENERKPIYSLSLPEGWQKIEEYPADSLKDTTKPLGKWKKGEIILTVYNFPFSSLQERIPPHFQVDRWRKQLDAAPESILIEPQAFSGYKGLYFEGIGFLEGKPSSMMAWALSLGDGHSFTLRKIKNRTQREDDLINNLLSDITLKATGPRPSLEEYHDEIVAIARSFETINPFP